MPTQNDWKRAIEGARETLVNEYAAQGLDVEVKVHIRGRGLFHSIELDNVHIMSLRRLPEVHAYLQAMRRGAQQVRWAIAAKREREVLGIDRVIRQDRARERVLEVRQVPINTDNYAPLPPE